MEALLHFNNRPVSQLSVLFILCKVFGIEDDPQLLPGSLKAPVPQSLKMEDPIHHVGDAPNELISIVSGDLSGSVSAVAIFSTGRNQSSGIKMLEPSVFISFFSKSTSAKRNLLSTCTDTSRTRNGSLSSSGNSC